MRRRRRPHPEVQLVGIGLVITSPLGHAHWPATHRTDSHHPVGVRQVVKKLKGEATEKQVDTGAVLVTKENMDTPEVKGLLPGS